MLGLRYIEDRRGMTLLEVVVAAVLSFLVLAAAFGVFWQTLGFSSEAGKRFESGTALQSGVTWVVRDLRNAADVVLPAVNSSGAELRLEVASGGAAASVRYELQGADLLRVEGSRRLPVAHGVDSVTFAVYRAFRGVRVLVSLEGGGERAEASVFVPGVRPS